MDRVSLFRLPAVGSSVKGISGMRIPVFFAGDRVTRPSVEP